MKLRNIVWWFFIGIVVTVCYFATRGLSHPYAAQCMLILSVLVIWPSLWLSSMAQDAYLKEKAFMLDPMKTKAKDGVYFAQFAGFFSGECPMFCMWKADINTASMVANWEHSDFYRYVFRPPEVASELLAACRTPDHSQAKALDKGCFLVIKRKDTAIKLFFHPASDQITRVSKNVGDHPQICSTAGAQAAS